MSDYGTLGDLFTPTQGDNGRIVGVVVGVVTNNQDESGQGRVKVRFPWLSATHESHWARVATLMAGADMGVYCLPDVNDEVLVVFEHGNIDRPFVIGSLWNGREAPPANNADRQNNVRMVKSRSGHTIKLDDTAGAEKITITDGQQKSSITLDAALGSVSITSEGDLNVQVRGRINLRSESEVSINGVSVSINDGALRVQG